MHSLWTLILSALGALSVSRAYKILGYIQSLKGLPRSFVLFHPMSFPGLLLPSNWFSAGADYGWKYRLYSKEKYGENLVLIPLLQGGPTIMTSNLDVTRQFIGVGTTGHQAAFRKPVMSGPLGYWSPNIFTAEGESWKRHKRVLLPAFNSQLYDLVWQESIRTYRLMMSAEGWDNQDEVRINRVQDFTTRFAMLIIGKCGFGFDWKDSLPSTDPSNNITLEKAMHAILDGAMFLGFVPNFVMKMPSRRIREVVRVAEEFTGFMKARATEKHDEFMNGGENFDGHRKDILTLLVKANVEETGKHKLNDQELIGNSFLMLFAGHETTASALAVCFAHLAAYPEIQEDTYQQVVSVLGSEEDPSYECFSKLDQVQGVFFECIRLFPPGYAIVRDVVDDTVLNIPNGKDREETIPLSVPKGTRIISDMVGIQYNSRYFHDPAKFIPSRWKSGDSEPETLSAFSVGPRACIGRKFAIVEGVSVLAAILRDWKIEPLLREGENIESWKKRVFTVNVAVTLAMANVPVKLIKRH